MNKYESVYLQIIIDSNSFRIFLKGFLIVPKIEIKI